MSQAPPERVGVTEPALDPGTGAYQYPPPSAHNKVTPGETNFIDGSGPIFSMYMEMATEEDKKMAEAWQADADGILIFTGLFSAAVASLISVSIQDIQENPQDTSNFYLSNIYRNMADPNISSSLPTSPPPFSPPNYAIWVNALWFLSLVISITCALLATLLQQWARRYLKVTQPRYSPHKRARIRAFFAEGVDKFLLPWAVEALPTLLHVSLFLFFSGLAVFLWNVNLTIFKLVLSWVGVCTALYGVITLVPLFRHDSPYHTPLSLPIWYIVTGIPIVKFRVLRWFSTFPRFRYATYDPFWDLEQSSCKLLAQGMQKMAEETALKSPSEIDTRAFLWTFDSLDEDHELERFFSSLPGFRSSKMVKDPLPDLTWEQKWKLSDALIGLLDRTFSSDLLPEPVKLRRTVICTKAIDPADIPKASRRVLTGIGSEDQYGPTRSAEIARLVRGWDNGRDAETTVIIQAVVLSLVARAQPRNDLWFTMASKELGVSESVLRNHATHGDSLSLSILIHITRQQFSRFREQDWPRGQFSKVLLAASKFNALDTSPELQNDFCALWNQIVRKVQADDGQVMAFYILGQIRNVFVALHHGTDSAPTHFSTSTGDRDGILWWPPSYPLCNIPAHHPDSILHIHDVSSPATTTHSVPLDNVTPVPVCLFRSPDAPSSSVPTLRDDENCVDVSLFDNNIPASFRPTGQIATESPCVPTVSSDPAAAAGATRDIEASAHTTPPTTPAASTFAFLVSPTSAFSLQNTTNLLVHPDTPAIPRSASAGPVPDDIPDSHCSILPEKYPGTSPPLTSAPGSRKDEDTLDPPSVDRAIQANTITVLDILPHSSPLPSTPDVPIAGPSQRESDIMHAGDHPPHPPRSQYDAM